MAVETLPSSSRFEAPRYNDDGSYSKEFAWGIISSKVNIVSGNLTLIEEQRAPAWRQGPRFSAQPDAWGLFYAEDVEVEDEATAHPESDAKYAVSAHKGRYFRFPAPDGKECILFAWGMKPNGNTSQPPHVHGKNPAGEPVFEHHFVIAGDIKVNGQLIKAGHNKDEDGNEIPNYHKASPGEPHAAASGDDGAVVLILLQGTAGIPDENIHERFDEEVEMEPNYEPVNHS